MALSYSRRYLKAAAIAAGAGVILVSASALQVAAADTLQSELRQLLANHPKLKAARKSVEGAGEGIREANSAYLPKVTLSGDTGPETVDSPARRSTEGETFFDTRKSTTLTVTQNLFEGFRSDAASRIAELERDSSAQDYRISEQTLLLDGIRAYVTVLKQSHLLEIAKANEHTLLEQLRLESARVERGSGLAVDVLQAKSRLQLARERVVTIYGELRQALSTYMQVFDRAAAPARMIVPAPPTEALPKSLEAALDIAASESSVLKRTNKRVDIASERRTVVDSAYWPRIDLVGEGNWENDVDGVSGMRREAKVVVRAVWDIFDGYLTPARSSKATLEYGAALDTRMAADRDVRDRVRRAWEQYQTTAEQKELLENAVNIAAEVFEARKKLRQSGRESVINLLDAESELNGARLRLGSAKFDLILAGYRLLLQSGRLTPETLAIAR